MNHLNLKNKLYSDDNTSETASSSQVLLISMPIANPNHPSIGISILKEVLKTNGINCDLRHFYLDFVEFLGHSKFELVNDQSLFQGLIGEWLFTADANSTDSSVSDVDYILHVIQHETKSNLSLKKLNEILEVRKSIPQFLDYCTSKIDWGNYKIVGFTTSFQQTMASIALARKVKALFKDIVIVFGGANTEDEMGIELMQQYDFIDFVVAGEAELTFPDLTSRVLDGRRIDSIPGVTRRIANKVIPPTIPSEPIKDLDNLPIADYSDFVKEMANLPSVKTNYPIIPLFESARGCWWGQKNHCTFCGLNARGMAFRSKTQSRAYEEITSIAQKFGTELMVVDNILDNKYFEDFIPRLANSNPKLLMHYEVKANLKTSQISALACAGARKLQPGIESLSTDVLKLMRKGTSMLRNIQTLKLAAEAGIFVDWGYLYGFPGEKEEYYTEAKKIVPLIRHLSPPNGFHRVRADRFSPYFNTPDKFKISIEPLNAYKYVFPFPTNIVKKLAYHFEIIHFASTNLADAHRELENALNIWKTLHSNTALFSTTDLDGLSVITDKRCGANEKIISLDSCSSFILDQCTTISSISSIKSAGSTNYKEEDIASSIHKLLTQGLIIAEDEHLLSLPLRQPGFRRSPLINEIRDSLNSSYFFMKNNSLVR